MKKEKKRISVIVDKFPNPDNLKETIQLVIYENDRLSKKITEI